MEPGRTGTDRTHLAATELGKGACSKNQGSRATPHAYTIPEVLMLWAALFIIASYLGSLPDPLKRSVVQPH